MNDILFGLAIFASSIVGIWFCKANKDGTKKQFLRGAGIETIVGIAITAGLGFGIPMAVAGIAAFYNF